MGASSGNGCLCSRCTEDADTQQFRCLAGTVADQIETVVVHGNSVDSMSGTEVYYLINNTTGAIDKIGITSQGEKRYPQSYYQAQDVTYVPQAEYQWRYPAMVDENIRLTWYQIEHGQLPRLNQVTR